MSPIGWKFVGFTWGYVILSFIIINFLKILFFDVADHSGIIFRRLAKTFTK
jgi:hypothetical protein